MKGGKPRQPDQNSTQEKNVERVLQVGRGAAIFPGTTYPGRPEHFRYFPEKWKSHWAARESILNLEKVPPNPLQRGAGSETGRDLFSLYMAQTLDGGGKV